MSILYWCQHGVSQALERPTAHQVNAWFNRRSSGQSYRIDPLGASVQSRNELRVRQFPTVIISIISARKKRSNDSAPSPLHNINNNYKHYEYDQDKKSWEFLINMKDLKIMEALKEIRENSVQIVQQNILIRSQLAKILNTGRWQLVIHLVSQFLRSFQDQKEYSFIHLFKPSQFLLLSPLFLSFLTTFLQMLIL